MWLNVMATSHTHAERLAPVPPCTLTATHNIHTHEALSLDWCYDLFVSVVAFTWVKIPHLILLFLSPPGVCLGVIDGLGVLCLFPCGRWCWGRVVCRGGSAEWGSYWWWLINGLSGGWRPLAAPQYRVSSTGRKGWWALHLHAIPMECVKCPDTQELRNYLI